MTLQKALFGLIALALVAGLVPAGIILDRRLASSLEAKARDDLKMAPELLTDRESMIAEADMMHAKELASAAGLAERLAAGDRTSAIGIVERAAAGFAGEAILVGRDGTTWSGIDPGPEAIARARAAGVAGGLLSQDGRLWRIALAAVSRDGTWLGASGLANPVDMGAAGTLAGLTRSEVSILFEAETVVSTAPDAVAAQLVDSVRVWRGDGQVHELRIAGGHRYLIVSAPLGAAATVAFARDLDDELAVLPQLRRVAGLAGLAALVVALALGTLAAAALARPVRALSHAAQRLAAGDFDAPLRRSPVVEVDRVTHAFDDMRKSLAARLAEVERANLELADRQRRLTALQAELIQRDRLAASGRLVAELAHEIRNPVANVRNCLEVIRRRVDNDPNAREFADMAIDELLRMHELAERMLDLHRPRDPKVRRCDAAAVVDEVVALVRAGAGDAALEVESRSAGATAVAMPPDALKQVLLNIVQNARESVGDAGKIEIEVESRDALVAVEICDDGPGIPADILPKIFDPFFTTKAGVHGVGLGLFVAEGIVRSYGGRLTAANRQERSGARFRIEIGAAKPDERERVAGPPSERWTEARR